MESSSFINLSAQDTPITNPGRYIKFGSSSHKILLYAQFRRKQTFTSHDYKNFAKNGISLKLVCQSLLTLRRNGYLLHEECSNSLIAGMKNSYMISASGQHALLFLARKNQERIEKENRRIGLISASEGWTNRKNQITDKKSG